MQLQKNFQTRELIDTVQHSLEDKYDNVRIIRGIQPVKKKMFLFEDDMMIHIDKKVNGQTIKKIYFI